VSIAPSHCPAPGPSLPSMAIDDRTKAGNRTMVVMQAGRACLNGDLMAVDEAEGPISDRGFLS